jgi:uncharacterized metal-binding protein YceD (DUF177 family)
VKKHGEYVVRFSELKEDTETFEYSLEEKFFQLFSSPEWESGKIRALVRVSKRADGITLDVRLDGTLTVICDRCLDAFPHPVAVRQTLFVKYGQEEEELDANVVVVSREENQVELGTFMYEYLVLALPVRRVHPDAGDGTPGCNPDMLEKLEKHIVKEETERTDPRWDELKKLMDKN